MYTNKTNVMLLKTNSNVGRYCLFIGHEFIFTIPLIILCQNLRNLNVYMTGFQKSFQISTSVHQTLVEIMEPALTNSTPTILFAKLDILA